MRVTLDDLRITPSHAFEDGNNYVPSRSGFYSVIILPLSRAPDRW